MPSARRPERDERGFVGCTEPTGDDLAIALVTTRGTRAWDLLHEFELPREAMVAAAGSDQATAAD
jgi:hypothetical protein